MKLVTLIILVAAQLTAQRTHPSMIVTPTLLSAMKQKARDNTVQWQKLKGPGTYSCDWATTYTALTADNLPPVYGYRGVKPSPIWVTGSLDMGNPLDTNGYYQGDEAKSTLLNLGACYLALKDGDVDIAGSTAGTADEVALAAKYGAQAIKILDVMTSPYAKVTPTTPPTRWEGFTWMPAFFVDIEDTTGAATVTTGCTVPGERRVLVVLRQHALTAGAPLVLSGITGGLATLNGASLKVSATGLTAIQFMLEDAATSAPICSSVGSTNINFDFLADAGYPLRNVMGPPALAMDWLYNHASMTSGLRTQIADNADAWFRHTMIADSSANLTAQYETNTQVNYHWGFFNAYGLAGIAFKGEDARAETWYNHWRNVMLLGRDEPFLKRWMQNSGSFMEAWQYMPFSIQMIGMTLLANETALGDDLFHHPTQPMAPFVLGQMEYFKQSLQPNGHTILYRNMVNYNPGTLPFETNRITLPALYMTSYLADKLDSPLKNKMRKLTKDAYDYLQTATGSPLTTDTSQFLAFLFWEPSGAMEEWPDAPLSKAMQSNPLGGYGHVTMRSDWGTNATYASFVAAPNTSDIGNGKEMFDKGSLVVQRGNATLLVNVRAECWRYYNINTTVGTACYGALWTPGGAGLGQTADSVFYLRKPGQPENSYGYLEQGKNTSDSATLSLPASPAADVIPDQQLVVTADPATDTFTVVGDLPTAHNLINGRVAYYTYGDGLTNGAPPTGISRGVKYYVRAVSGSTFKLATTDSDTTIVNFTTAGTSTQYVFAGNGPSNKSRQLTYTHPTRVDRYVDTAGYTYARGVNLHKTFVVDNVFNTHYPLANWQREVMFLRPKLFVIYDRTVKTPKSTGTQKSISTVGNTTPISITTTAAHGYHTGMTVTPLASTVAAINGNPYTITVTSTTAFTLDGTTAAGAGTLGGTVSGTVLYQPTMAWTAGRTPTLATVPEGTRYNVSDGATFKGAITAVLPVAHTASVRDVGGFGVVHQIQVAAPMESDVNNFLTVVDTADAAVAVDANTRLTTSAGIDGVLIRQNLVVGFCQADPCATSISYTVPSPDSVTHYLSGFAPGSSYTVNGSPVVANAGGVLEFADSTGTVQIGAPASALIVTPTSLAFVATAGQPSPAAQTVAVSRSVSDDVYTVAESCAWLSVSPMSGMTPATLTLTPDTTAMAVGSYSCPITVTSAGAMGSPATITATLDVSAFVPPADGTVSVAASRRGVGAIVTLRGVSRSITYQDSCVVTATDTLGAVAAEDSSASGLAVRRVALNGLTPGSAYALSAVCTLDGETTLGGVVSAPATAAVNGDTDVPINPSCTADVTVNYGLTLASTTTATHSAGRCTTSLSLPAGTATAVQFCRGTACGAPIYFIP